VLDQLDPAVAVAALERGHQLGERFAGGGYGEPDPDRPGDSGPPRGASLVVICLDRTR
jgi:hypothetical protein